MQPGATYPAMHLRRRTPDGNRCTGVWFATHGLNRGSCTHIRL